MICRGLWVHPSSKTQTAGRRLAVNVAYPDDVFPAVGISLKY